MSSFNDDAVSRRAFGQLLGAAALGSALPRVAAAIPSVSSSLEHRELGMSQASAPTVSADDALCNLTATDLVARIKRKEVSARDVMSAHLARIERVNPRVNAIVTLVGDRAMTAAKAADERQAKGATLGPLHGLPVAHKDLVPTAGIRTTYGSPFYANNIPTQDALIITRIPVLLGSGIPLFGFLPHDIRLEHVATRSYASGLVQSEYAIAA